MAHPPGSPAPTPHSHSWCHRSHKPLKTGPGGPTERGPVPAGSARPDEQGQGRQKARNPHPLPCKHVGGEGLGDDSMPTPGHSQGPSLQKPVRNASNSPSQSETGRKGKEPPLRPPCPRPASDPERPPDSSAQPSLTPHPSKSKLPSPGGRPSRHPFFPPRSRTPRTPRPPSPAEPPHLPKRKEREGEPAWCASTSALIARGRWARAGGGEKTRNAPGPERRRVRAGRGTRAAHPPRGEAGPSLCPLGPAAFLSGPPAPRTPCAAPRARPV